MILLHFACVFLSDVLYTLFLIFFYICFGGKFDIHTDHVLHFHFVRFFLYSFSGIFFEPKYLILHTKHLKYIEAKRKNVYEKSLRFNSLYNSEWMRTNLPKVNRNKWMYVKKKPNFQSFLYSLEVFFSSNSKFKVYLL